MLFARSSITAAALGLALACFSITAGLLPGVVLQCGNLLPLAFIDYYWAGLSPPGVVPACSGSLGDRILLQFQLKSLLVCLPAWSWLAPARPAIEFYYNFN